MDDDDARETKRSASGTTVEADPTLRTARGASETVELSRARRAAARRVAEAKAIVPHVYYDTEVDLGQLSASRDRLPKGASLREVLVRAAAIALREVPAANGSYRDGKLERHSRVNVAFASPAGDGETVYPVVLDADRKPIAEIAAEASELAARAARAEITSRELAGATFTLVVLDHPGTRGIAPVVIPPQAAALGAGPPTAAPVIRDGRVEAGELVALTLACDGRAVLDHEAAALLAAVSRILTTPGLAEL